MNEKLCLKWNDFQENVNTVFESLRQHKDFSDVTLASDDGQQFEAHKILLATLSPIFRNIFKADKTGHPHPLIFMQGVKSEDLRAFIDFLYCAPLHRGQLGCMVRNLTTWQDFSPFS